MYVKNLMKSGEGFSLEVADCNTLFATKGLQKNWIPIAMIDNEHLLDTVYNPSGIDNIWINFTSDSVFLHGFCPTVGNEYFLYAGDNIDIGSLGIQEECDVPYDWPAWNHDCFYNLMHADAYELSASELRINSTRRFDLLFVAEEYYRVIGE